MYINKETGEYPIFEEDIRKIFKKTTSFPTPFVAPEPYELVDDIAPPVMDNNIEVAEELDPILVDGKYSKAWSVKPKHKTKIELDAALDIQKKNLIASLASIRYEKEVNGYTHNGVVFDSDDRAQLKVLQTLGALNSGALTTLDWKTRSGWIQVDLASLSAVYDAGLAFVANLFAIEKQKTDEINAVDTFDKLYKIKLLKGWPV